MTEWISTSDRMPEDGQECLTATKLHTIPKGWSYHVYTYSTNLYKVDKYDFMDRKGDAGFYKYDSDYGYYAVPVDYWMPIPDPPAP